ncbi:DUF86 domain-containing protein [Brevibacillus sp. SYP-B805]|uniref:DUF86 domain-containing protein n=1 Tax=Brevibacillus sp. SYP-B805 TaxID=1578199 RepID=UPI0013EAA24A|nr:DUF86 domain-containing protein [Brevibacillus sp. SYP-B805]NGQ96951.1 DUF86 domain-containing protein [Brevibacillus sp. SYP-B805]
MYDVNTGRIEEVLAHMDRMLQVLRAVSARSDGEIAADAIAVAAMERALHLCIEGIADVGNALIDGFIMRDPGSYADIVEILRDEKVIDDRQAERLGAVVAFRKSLVNEYTSVPVADMIRLVRESVEWLETFAPAVRTYIQQELF